MSYLDHKLDQRELEEAEKALGNTPEFLAYHAARNRLQESKEYKNRRKKYWASEAASYFDNIESVTQLFVEFRDRLEEMDLEKFIRPSLENISNMLKDSYDEADDILKASKEFDEYYGYLGRAYAELPERQAMQETPEYKKVQELKAKCDEWVTAQTSG